MSENEQESLLEPPEPDGTPTTTIATTEQIVGYGQYVEGLRTQPLSLRQLAWMANMLAGEKGKMGALALPEALQGHPADVLAVMLAGRELGIGPMQATRQIHIIKGQTALSTELKLALARRAGHDIRPVDRCDEYCAVHCDTHGSHMIVWTLPGFPDVLAQYPSAIVVPSNLVDKDNWKTYPAQMLWARAVAQLCREHCPEAVGGLYSVEELSTEGGGYDS